MIAMLKTFSAYFLWANILSVVFLVIQYFINGDTGYALTNTLGYFVMFIVYAARRNFWRK